jgi:hypothetical protein
MNCPDCRDSLQQWFDARTPDAAPPPLCPVCAEWGVAAGRLDHGLRLLAASAAPASLADRIVARIRARRRRRVRILFAAGGVAAAAMVLLAVWFSFPVRQPTKPEVNPPFAVKTPELEPVAPSVNLRNSVAQAGSAMASLTSRTADETVAKTRALLPAVVDPSVGKLDLPTVAPARSFRETGESVTAGLEPVADSARRAVSLFFRELPPMDAAPKTGF